MERSLLFQGNLYDLPPWQHWAQDAQPAASHSRALFPCFGKLLLERRWVSIIDWWYSQQ